MHACFTLFPIITEVGNWQPGDHMRPSCFSSVATSHIQIWEIIYAGGKHEKSLPEYIKTSVFPVENSFNVSA